MKNPEGGRRQPFATLSGTQQIVLTALLFALSLVLATVENTLPPLPLPLPGVKFGLSNIAVMYALFFLGARPAYTIALLKGAFVFAVRGPVAGALSLSGGLLSVTVMVVLLLIFGERISYLILSILGAVSHNLGQFGAISVIYTGMNLLPYLPFLLLAGLVAGLVTSSLLRVVLPALHKLG